MKMSILRSCGIFFFVALFVLLAVVMSVKDAQAIPAWARKYKTSCSTCHYAYPKLNGFGKAFKNNGYRYPGGDENYRKEEPTSLGSESYKKVWPDAIWPADIPGGLPIAIQAIGRVNYEPDADIKSTFEFPHELEVLFGGTIGENVSFLGEVEIENEDNENQFAFPFHLQWDFNPRWHIRVGNVSPDPTPEGRRLTRNHYNVASFRSRNRVRLRDEHAGIELWGAGNGAGGRGGYRFQLGVVNGQGRNDANSEKDFYGLLSYKIGGLGVIGGTEGQASETSDFYVDNNLRLGGYFYIGTATKDAVDEDFQIFGGNFDFWYNRFILNGTLLYMNSELPGTPDRQSLVWYVESNYVIYPWLIGLARFEFTDSDLDVDTPDPVTSLIPAVTIVARANVRFTAEYIIPLDDASKKKDLFVIQAQFGF
ncbi:MAG: hypothetical protein ACE5HS_15435 [bacterium]